ncbi:MAG: AAA family ATPase [Bacteroidales bacterium]
MLVIVCGLQGTGKTFVARKIAETLNAKLLRTDVIRKELYREISYSGKEMQDIYSEMLSRAARLFEDHKNIVLDATFSKAANRHAARELATLVHTDYKVVEVKCEETILEQRIKNRKDDESDAGFDVYLMYKKVFERITEPHITIDNSGSLEDTHSQIEVFFNPENSA